MKKNIEIGIEEGDLCNRNGCSGIIEEYEKDGCCQCCIIIPPCSYCTEDTAHCNKCGWSAQEDADELWNATIMK